jgi:hypothetical protein
LCNEYIKNKLIIIKNLIILHFKLIQNKFIMVRKAVSSSNIASIGYDEKNQILEIEFNRGGIYQYVGVPSSVHKALMNADSHGKYFSANIRNDYHPVKL